MPDVHASVGVANGKQCYNVPADQLVVQGLLTKIPVSMGGQLGKTDWIIPRWGFAAADLSAAILHFQQVNRSRLSYGADGHVDPGLATIRLMNQLAAFSGGGAVGSSTQTSVTPNIDDFRNAPSGVGLPDYLGLAASGIGTGFDLVALGVELGLAELVSPLIGIVTTWMSLPLAWKAADDLARYNGRCQGFWDAMQDMADAFKDNSLDKKPLSDWPPIPYPHPHFGSTPESQLQASEVEWRGGQALGAVQAFQYVDNMERNPQEFPAKAGDKAITVKLTGKQWLRELRKKKSGGGEVAQFIHDEIDKNLRAQGRPEWPVWK
jgi:hypothetical protein